MDYLDHHKEFRHRVILFTGYICITVGIVIATMVLVYRAYGFGLGKNGSVVQNGLIFLSSHPHPADIYVNGSLSNARTNSRLPLPEGIYSVRLARNGYHDWQRSVQVIGSGVRHFDYPFLIPKQLTSKKLTTLTGTSGLMTQSPDRRWLLLEQSGSMTDFVIYDLKNPARPPDTLTLPASVLTKAAGTGSESWQLGEWADDNQHLLLQHLYDGKTEYIMVNRSAPEQSLNLNTTLSAAPSKLTLSNQKFDQYYLYDAVGQTLQSASLRNPTPVPVLTGVITYQVYGNNTILFVTDDGATKGHVVVKLSSGARQFTLRSLSAGATYLVDLTKYRGKLYVAAGSSSQSKVYIYKDPLGQLAAQPQHALVPVQVMHVIQPNYLSFSENDQYVVVENGTQFSVYDVEDALGHVFTAPHTLDSPAVHAGWMDGNRLTYVSGGKQLIFDYDNTNQQTLMAADAAYLPAFDPDYKYVYTLAPAATPGQQDLLQTALLTPGDL